MLDSTYKIERKHKDEYRMSLPMCRDWQNKDQRVLVVLETVDSEDLTEHRLLHNRSRIVLENLLRFASQRARDHGFKRSSCAFAAINFNNIKFMDKPKDVWPTYKSMFTKRIESAIAEIKPTHVLILGDHAAEYLLSEHQIEFARKKRGWVYDLTIKKQRVKVCTSLDLHPLYSAKRQDDDSDDDDGEMDKDIYSKANLLFYVSDHVQNLLCGKLLFDLSDVKPKVKYVDTIEKFDALWKLLKTEKVIALDTETKNGTVKYNAIHTIQFAFSADKSYFLPYKHPETPFSAKEIRYIGKKLRKLLMAKPGVYGVKYLITQYGMFDLRVCRVEFGIPVIQHKVWEITAGEYMLDENRTELAGSPFNTPHGGLEQIFMVYGNDHYKKSKFGKGDRANANLTKLSNPDFIEYGGMDVQSIFGIHEQQKRRASYLQVGDQPFLPHYKRLVLHQMSNTVHSLSHMREKGSSIDKKYMTLLKSTKSPLLKLRKEALDEMMKAPELKKANKLLLRESSGQASHKGLFAEQKDAAQLSVFDFGKADHKELLFFNVLGLKPISFTKGKKPQVNKTFIKAYEKEQPLVAAFGRYQKISKLWSAYVKGWWNKIQASADSMSDWKLRPDYGFFDVVTGRLNSKNPSLQQVPTRGAEAKYIKRAFIAHYGTLLIKYDYSAHEIRVWSYVSGDEVLAAAFKVGQKLRRLLYLATSPERVQKILDKLKKKGDIHIQNVFRFFGEWVDKDHFLRDAIKAVVFGVVYAKSARSLANDLKKPVEFAQEVIAKMFGEFVKGAAWLKWTKKHAEENYYTYSPIGMRRNLMGIMTGVPAIVNAMTRRAANSPIQGLASQIGVTASRLITLEAYDTFLKLGYIDEDTTEMPADIVKAVHDALHSETPYRLILVYVHIVQWVATFGVTEYYKKTFGLKFTVEPEIEMEFGASEDAMYKWNWTEDNLKECLTKALEDQKKVLDKEFDTQKVLKSIYAAYDNPKTKKYLEDKYPILGVVKGRKNEHLA